MQMETVLQSQRPICLIQYFGMSFWVRAYQSLGPFRNLGLDLMGGKRN